jgi:hypothetical protein
MNELEFSFSSGVTESHDFQLHGRKFELTRAQMDLGHDRLYVSIFDRKFWLTEIYCVIFRIYGNTVHYKPLLKFK